MWFHWVPRASPLIAPSRCWGPSRERLWGWKKWCLEFCLPSECPKSMCFDISNGPNGPAGRDTGSTLFCARLDLHCEQNQPWPPLLRRFCHTAWQDRNLGTFGGKLRGWKSAGQQRGKGIYHIQGEFVLRPEKLCHTSAGTDRSMTLRAFRRLVSKDFWSAGSWIARSLLLPMHPGGVLQLVGSSSEWFSVSSHVLFSGMSLLPCLPLRHSEILVVSSFMSEKGRSSFWTPVGHQLDTSFLRENQVTSAACQKNLVNFAPLGTWNRWRCAVTGGARSSASAVGVSVGEPAIMGDPLVI